MLKHAIYATLGVILGSGLLWLRPLMAQEKLPVVDAFTLPNDSGKMISLDQFADQKAVVLIFTSANCSWAQKYDARIQQLYQAYRSKGVAFIAINSNDPTLSRRDDRKVMRTYAPFEFPYLKDLDQAVARALEATKNPEAFLLVPHQGKFVVAYRGRIDDHPLEAKAVKEPYLRDALNRVLEGKRPERLQTEPQGCNIRWSETANR